MHLLHAGQRAQGGHLEVEREHQHGHDHLDLLQEAGNQVGFSFGRPGASLAKIVLCNGVNLR